MRLPQKTLLLLILAVPPCTALGADPPSARGSEAPLPPPPKTLEARPSPSPDLRPNLPVSPEQAAVRSLLLPGLGQIQTERPVSGGIFMGAALTSLGGSIFMAVRTNEAIDIYEAAPMGQRDAAYQQAQQYAKTRNVLIGTTVIIWALGVADAYFFHPDRK